MSRRHPLLLLVLLLLAVRLPVAWQRFEALQDDRDHYRVLASRLAAGDGLVHPQQGTPTAFRPPLYPLVLAGIERAGLGDIGVAGLHLLLGLLTVVATWQLGLRLGLAGAAWWAAALVAVDPLLVAGATLPMTETLFTAVAAGLLAVAAGEPSPRRDLSVGLLFGLAAVCRPSVWIFGGLAAAAWAIRRRPGRSDQQPATSPRVTLTAVAIGLAVTVGPWFARNLVVGGTPVLTTTHGGFTLLLGNNPVFYDQVVRRPWGTVWSDTKSDPGKTPREWREDLERRLPNRPTGIAAERTRDRWMYARAIEHITADPGGFARACLLRLGRFWSPWPLETGVPVAVKWLVAAWYALLGLAMLRGLWSRPWQESPGWGGPLLLLVGLVAVHLLFWSTMRMRAPVMPVVALLAARGFLGCRSLPGRLLDAVIARRGRCLLLAVALAAAAIVPAGRLSFDQSIESLYAENNPRLAAFRYSRGLFGGDEFVFVAYDEPELLMQRTGETGESETLSRLQPEAARRLTEFAESLSSIKGVQQDSTQHLATALAFPYGRRRVLELVEGVLVGDDRRTVAIVLRLARRSGSRASQDRAATFAEIRRQASRHQPPAEVVGEPVQVHDMFRYVEEDGRTLFWWSLGLLAAVILLIFRRLRWVILPLTVVVVAILWTEALLVISGMRLSMVSSMLNSLLTIIGIATVTHVTVHYRECRGTLDRTAALRKTFTDLAPAVFWTGVTTATGFAALLSSSITPVQSFGIMMTLGTMMVLLAALLVLPGGILLGGMSADPGRAPGEGQLVRGLETLARGIQRRPAVVLLAAGLVVGLAGAGLGRLRVETDFSENFRENSPIRRGLAFFESRLGGAGNWEVNFPAPETLTQEYLDEVEVLAASLRREVEAPSKTAEGPSRLTKVVALSDGLALVPRLPFILNTLGKRLKMLNRFQSEYVQSLYSPEGHRMRIVLRAMEREQAGEKLKLIERIEELARRNAPTVEPASDDKTGVRPVEATGLYVLLTFLIESLLRDQLVSFGLAAVGITAVMTLAFGSLRIGLVALVPNLFPIVLVIGAMGWIGLPINIATAMIASVSLGLTVDSSIHYISGFRRARAEGLDVDAALQRTHTGVGRAVVLANLALVVGFSVLTLSHFIPLVYFGILVSVAMLGGLVGNLVLLPVLLRWLHRTPSSTRSPSPVDQAADRNVAAP